MDRLLSTNKELKSLCKQEIQIISSRMDCTKNGEYKDLQRGTQSDKVVKCKAFAIENNLKLIGYERSLTAMVSKFFNKKSKGAGIKNGIKENQQLAEENHKPIIGKFKKRKVYSSFKANIWGC